MISNIVVHPIKQTRLTVLPPLSLYVHFPWCIQKCPYCDFNSHTLKENIPESFYIDTLIKDLEQDIPLVWGRPIRSIFLGGGTPSLFSPQEIDRFISAVRARCKVLPDVEITLEANPGTFEKERFQAYAEYAGVNRISIGVQSFSNRHLLSLGRIHNSDEAKKAIEHALSVFDRVNIDLMYALPHQSIDEACHDFSMALSLGVSHVSAYHLTMEPHTYFASHPPSGLPSDDLAADIHQAVYQTLSSGGVNRYEVSAFSSHQEHRCRHNINYWQFGDYLGIGAGAHSKISNSSHIVRRMKIKQPPSYMKASLQSQFIQSERTVAPKDLPFEFMMNALRLVDGVPKSLWLERTGMPIHVLDKSFGKACDLGLLENHIDYFKPTELGLNFLNDLLTLFMPPQG